MTSFLRNFAADENGAAAAEYVLILAIVGAGVAGGAWYLGNKISLALTSVGDKVSNCAATTAGTQPTNC
jgi:pilus assembly protein Flp/PilA